jgi:hypothetical protein
MKTVIVAFTVSKEHSIYYKKKASDESHAYWEEIGYLLKEAFDKGADFVSIRFIKTDEIPEVPE